MYQAPTTFLAKLLSLAIDKLEKRLNDPRPRSAFRK
jgi:hypothetical protein